MHFSQQKTVICKTFFMVKKSLTGLQVMQLNLGQLQEEKNV